MNDSKAYSLVKLVQATPLLLTLLWEKKHRQKVQHFYPEMFEVFCSNPSKTGVNVTIFLTSRWNK